jgi:hypothetical protein
VFRLQAALDPLLAREMLRLAAIARRDARFVEQAGSGALPRNGEVVAVCGTIGPEGETLRSGGSARPKL